MKKFVDRLIGKYLIRSAKQFPVVFLSGPRRAGKTTLLRKTFPKADYILLDALDLIDRVRMDPRGFLETVSTPVILDEIQHIPELLPYIKEYVDKNENKKGQFLITGSQSISLMKGVTESLAGRVAIYELLPFSVQENHNVNILNGGFPEIVLGKIDKDIWFSSYLKTYVEKDILGMFHIKNLPVFRRFLSILASRVGALLNKAEIAASLGVSVPTVGEWVSILEMTGIITLIYPFYNNFGKRLVKSPKVYFLDTGLLCYLLGIKNRKQLMESIFLGQIFESFIASELIKLKSIPENQFDLFFFRTYQGQEIDFVVVFPYGKTIFLEVKAVRTLRPEITKNIQELIGKIEKAQGYIVYLSGKTKEVYNKIGNITAITEKQLLSILK